MLYKLLAVLVVALASLVSLVFGNISLASERYTGAIIASLASAFVAAGLSILLACGVQSRVSRICLIVAIASVALLWMASQVLRLVPD